MIPKQSQGFRSGETDFACFRILVPLSPKISPRRLETLLAKHWRPISIPNLRMCVRDGANDVDDEYRIGSGISPRYGSALEKYIDREDVQDGVYSPPSDGPPIHQSFSNTKEPPQIRPESRAPHPTYCHSYQPKLNSNHHVVNDTVLDPSRSTHKFTSRRVRFCVDLRKMVRRRRDEEHKEYKKVRPPGRLHPPRRIQPRFEPRRGGETVDLFKIRYMLYTTSAKSLNASHWSSSSSAGSLRDCSIHAIVMLSLLEWKWNQFLGLQEGWEELHGML